MCGIAGIAELGSGALADAGLLRRMCDAIEHRGPDDFGHLVDGGVGLGMRRLSIIDLAGGHQPLANEDETVWMVFNGEIYNFRELRRDLQARGHEFRTATDGEVVMHLWEDHGTDFPRFLSGMFSIALYDTRQRRLVLIRDRLGIKPLFYALNGERLVFGSEIKSLLASHRVARELDVDALGQFLAWEYVPGAQTLFQGIRKLRPGELLDLDLKTGQASTRLWWDIPLPGTNGFAKGLPQTEDEWAEAVQGKLSQCVASHLVSDVPLGAFLSGGVDSSLVVAAMGDARTFSIGFDDPTYNELPWARQVADHLGVRHLDEVIRPDIVELFDHLMQFMEDPIGDFSIFPTYLVSRLARQHVTVVLSGDGGDELFGGYETYVAQQTARSWGRIPSAIRKHVLEPVIRNWQPSPQKKGLVNKAKRFVEGLGHAPQLAHTRWRLFVGEAMQRELFSGEALAQMKVPVGDHVVRLLDGAGRRDDLDRQLYVDVKSYLCDNILTKVDRMSMACSLEARVPYLDHEMVELAFQMPSRLKVAAGRTKVLLKRVAARHVPSACVYRRKEGFSIPLKHWLNGAFRPLVEELLAPERLAHEGIFNAAAVARLKQEHATGEANHSHILWTMLVFQDWRRRWGV